MIMTGGIIPIKDVNIAIKLPITLKYINNQLDTTTCVNPVQKQIYPNISRAGISGPPEAIPIVSPRKKVLMIPPSNDNIIVMEFVMSTYSLSIGKRCPPLVLLTYL